MKLILIILLLATVSACSNRISDSQSYEEQFALCDSLVRSVRHDEQDLTTLIERFKAERNDIGLFLAYKELGKQFRDKSLFENAIEEHSLALSVAEHINDSLLMAQALNDIGTDYRRVGSLAQASKYHQRALDATESLDHSSEAVIKAHVMALNGLGNIYISINNFELADSLFRGALKGEHILNSERGKAINYANIGSIFFQRGEIDSARVYYTQSMLYNQRAGIQLGIALCHKNMGDIYETSGDHFSAISEYLNSYKILSKSKDHWHVLEPSIALAHTYRQIGDNEKSQQYLKASLAMARELNSAEHLSRIYNAYYQVFASKGQYQQALEALVKADAYRDSVANYAIINDIQNCRLDIEHSRQQDRLEAEKRTLQHERVSKLFGYSIFSLVVVALVISVSIVSYYLRKRIRQHRMQKELQETKDNFFRNFTNEFRTPLTVIASAAEELHGSLAADEETIHRNTSSIITHTKALTTLINQIVDIASLTASLKNPNLVWANGDIVGFAAMVCDGYADYASKKGVALVYNHKVGSLRMDFVPDYIEKTIRNILSNAIKFTPSGGLITVEAFADDSGHKFHIRITDTGEGIPDEIRDHIFEPFYVADTGRKSKGAGIGLSVVKMAVDAMGGSLDLHTRPGKGSTFDVCLPITNQREEVVDIKEYRLGEITDPDMDNKPVTTAIVNEEETEIEETEATILIVEDTPDVAYYMGRHLDRHRVCYATDGLTGLEKANEIVPDLIITDVTMPGIDGFELCRRIKKSWLTVHIPVVMVTARAAYEDRLAGLEAGADAYIEKPFRAEELNLRVDKLLEGRTQLKRKYSKLLIESYGDDRKSMEKGNALQPVLSDADNEYMVKITDIIRRDMASGDLNVNTIADKMCITRHQLNRKVNAIYGMSTSSLISQIRVNAAKEMLSSTTMPINDIATRCGIVGIAYFSALFKKITGTTPSQYRSDTMR